MPEIIICQNSKNYHVISFDTEISIGRDSDNGITLLSPQVSRKHAQIQQTGSHYRLLDLESTNAIWVGNNKIQTIELTHGTTFRIADFYLTFINDVTNTAQQLVLEDQEEQSIVEASENKTILATAFNKNEIDTSIELEHFINVAKDFSGKIQSLKNPDENEILEKALSTLCFLTKSSAGFIALLNTESDLIYRATVNFSPDSDNNCINHAIIKRVITSAKTELSDTSKDKKKKAQTLSTPLINGNKTIGCGYFLKNDAPYHYHDHFLCELIFLILSSFIQQQEKEKKKKSTSSIGSDSLESRKDIIIRSTSMLNLYRDAHTIAPINVPALILGEAGTGKELVAEELHSASKRKGEFITLNCSAIPEGIFESELFGSQKGAFQDAQDKPGKLELANNGTLFLDEIGDMSLQLQPKLLRFLENQEVVRLGDNRVRALNVRIVAATNKNLPKMIEKETFRTDLFQRLSCFTLTIPPLRDRVADVEPLIMFFLKKFSKEYGWQVPHITPKAMELLNQYTWHGNVRELRNTTLRLAVHSQGKTITQKDTFQQLSGLEQTPLKKVEAFPTLEQIEKKHIQDALREASSNISDASKLLGIARSTFYKKMHKYKISIL